MSTLTECADHLRRQIAKMNEPAECMRCKNIFDKGMQTVCEACACGSYRVVEKDEVPE